MSSVKSNISLSSLSLLDSLSLLVFLMRQRAGSIATMVDDKKETPRLMDRGMKSIVDKFDFIDFSE